MGRDMPNAFVVAISLFLHLLLGAFLFWLMPHFQLDLPVSLQSAPQSYLSASLVAQTPQTIPTAKPRDLPAASLSDSTKKARRGGNTKLDTNTADESKLKSSRKENKTKEKRETSSAKENLDKQKKQENKKNDDTKESEDSKESESTEGVGGIDQYSSFLRRINEALVQNWTRPESVQRGEPLIAMFLVRLNEDGTIQSLEIKESSGNALFDRSALGAIRKIPRFAVPKDKKAFQEHFQELTIQFENPN